MEIVPRPSVPVPAIPSAVARMPTTKPVTIAAGVSDSAVGPTMRAEPAPIIKPDRSAGDMSLETVIAIEARQVRALLCEADHSDPAGTLPAVGKLRLDTLLAERGLYESRSRAAAAVMAGDVRLGHDGLRADKPGQLVADDV